MTDQTKTMMTNILVFLGVFVAFSFVTGNPATALLVSVLVSTAADFVLHRASA